MEALTDPARRVMQLHICPKDCSHVVTGPDVLHASSFWEVGEKRQPWRTLEAAAVVPEEEDEMAKLRQHYAARAGLETRERPSPSVEAVKEKKKKKKKKKKEKDKEKNEEKGKWNKGDSEEEPQLERGQKSLRSLFGGTCLDPRVDERAKLLRKARRLGKKEGKKRKRSSSEDSTSGSSTSEEEDLTETGEGRFAKKKKKALRLMTEISWLLGCPNDSWDEGVIAHSKRDAALSGS